MKTKLSSDIDINEIKGETTPLSAARICGY